MPTLRNRRKVVTTAGAIDTDDAAAEQPANAGWSSATLSINSTPSSQKSSESTSGDEKKGDAFVPSASAHHNTTQLRAAAARPVFGWALDTPVSPLARMFYYLGLLLLIFYDHCFIFPFFKILKKTAEQKSISHTLWNLKI